MDINLYALRAYAEEKVEEARADSARDSLLASIRRPHHDVLGIVGAALIRIGHRLRHRSGARRAPRMPVPGLY